MAATECISEDADGQVHKVVVKRPQEVVTTVTVTSALWCDDCRGEAQVVL